MKTVVVVFAVLLIFTLPVHSTEADIGEMKEYIPESTAESLPDGIFDGTTEVDKAFDFNYFVDLIKNVFENELADSVISVSSLLGLVIASSLFHKLADVTKSGEFKNVFSAVSGLCVCICVFGGIVKLFERTSAYLTGLSAFATAITPFVTMVYAVGGNIGTAAVNETGFMVAVTVIEYIIAYVLYPVLSVSAVLTIASSATPKLRLGSLSGFVRGVLMLFIGFTVAAVSAVMTFQTSLSSAADTLGVRAVKFAASSFIPVVGSAVSEAVRTVSGSIGYIRTSVGFIGVASILIIALPVFVNLMITRIGLAVSASVADLLGCDREVKILKESGGLVNFLIALVSLSAIMFIYILTLLAKCSAAYGG